MAVKVSKIWSSQKFINLTNDSKLLYLYLATSPDINSVGVLSPNMEVISIHLSMSMEKLRSSTRELISKGYILVNKFDVMYVCVLAHFNTLPKSDSTVAKVQKTLNSLPDGLVKILKENEITTDRKAVVFNPPTIEEVSKYALSLGHKIEADKVVSFYEGHAKKRNMSGWVDSRGKKVKDWKSKIRIVWCKDENKLKEVKGAPEGFEHFYIMFEDKMIFPEDWRNGKPHSGNIAVKKALNREYDKKRKENS